MYHKVVNRLLSLSLKCGGKIGHLQQVEFFFYADTEDKASNLAVELSRFGYEIYGVDKSDDKWSIIGVTPQMKIDEAALTNWGQAMYALADKMEVVFDGWGMLIER